MIHDTNTQFIAKSDSWRMFNDISPKYDTLNHILSFGLDHHWRKCLARFLPQKTGQKVLDLATGTGEVLISLFKHNPHIQSGYGLDLSENMLAIGRRKITRQGLERYITLKHGNVNQLPFDNNQFNCVTMAFGIRNTEDPNRVLREMYRVLKKGGRAIIMEFSIPGNILIRTVFQFYIRYGVPFIGMLLSRHRYAYDYLNKTIHDFPYGNKFCDMMENSGFNDVRVHPLIFGAVSIYTGEKTGEEFDQ